MRKEILGWVLDGARWCIELPTKKLDAIITEIKTIMHKPAVTFKQFKKVVGKLPHAAIEIPAGKELCSLFNLTVAVNPKIVTLGKRGAV